MFNQQWNRIAEAARRCDAFTACDEAINQAFGSGINIRIDDSAVYPTILVAGKPIAIIITPRLSAPRPEIAVSVLGQIHPVVDLLESRGYRYSEVGWRKRLQLDGDEDEVLVQGLLSAVEEALLVLHNLIQVSLTEVQKSLQVLAQLKTQANCLRSTTSETQP